MKNRSLTVLLCLWILCAFIGSSFAGVGPGQKSANSSFEPVASGQHDADEAHPWEDDVLGGSGGSPFDDHGLLNNYGNGSGTGFQSYITALIAKLVHELYIKYIVTRTPPAELSD